MTPILTLLSLATVLPLFSAVLVIFFGAKLGKVAAWFATLVMAGCFVCAAAAMVLWLGSTDPQPQLLLIKWIPVPFGDDARWLYLGGLVDGLTIAMMTMVTMIATLVHLYSVGYMAGDKRYTRFFAYLSLFTFSMLGIVMANSLMQLFVFWELVGLTSYLLIGFWFEKRGPQLACKKAFVMNRVGDAGFLIGFGILFFKLGGNVMLPAAEGVLHEGEKVFTMLGAVQQVLAQESAAAGLKGEFAYSILNPPLWLTIAGIGIFFGAIGKSAQFPLHTWLPDAMEGPTPVSSIVHSATMVAAGVYLTARVYPILTPSAHLFIAIIGLVTLVMAACMALVMTDIKRVLAYSTLSQLGYMVLGLGAGAYSWALFHLITHAFFKCCLFQCSGSVIHSMHHEQDMRQYGGLMRKMPVTAACYFICTLAIAGASIPFTNLGISGFYSKDGIIAGTINYSEAMASLGAWAKLFWIGPTAVAYLTVFYMTRSFMLTFWGAPRNQEKHDHAHEAPWTMLVPQAVLAVMAVISVPMLCPWLSLINTTGLETATSGRFAELGVTWAQPGSEEVMHHAFHYTHAYLLHGLGWIASVALGFVIYMNGMGIAARIAALPGICLLHKWALNKFYFDALYDVFAVSLGKLVAHVCRLFDAYIVDGVVNLSGLITKVAAFATGGFDLKIVDGAVNGAAQVARSGGQMLRTTQAGRIRVYVLLMFCTAVIATLVVVVAAHAG